MLRCTFRIDWGVVGYTSDNYIVCLRKAQEEILSYDPQKFRDLEPNTPEARVFDKIAFCNRVRSRCRR